MNSVRILEPFKDSTKIWRGPEEEGLGRNLFRIIGDPWANADNMAIAVEE